MSRRVGFGPDQYEARAVAAVDRIEARGIRRCVAIFVLAGILAPGAHGDVMCFLETVIREATRRMIDLPPEQFTVKISEAGPEYFRGLAIETMSAVGIFVDDDGVWVAAHDEPVRTTRTLRLVVDNAPRGAS